MALFKKLSILFTIWVLSFYAFSVSAQCACCYCDAIINWQCYIYKNGQLVPGGCIGCLGTCKDGRCFGAPGAGGCGPVIMWCRDSDCQGGGGGGCHACGCCIPTSCGGGKVGFLEEKPFVLVGNRQSSNNSLISKAIKEMSISFLANVTLFNEKIVKKDMTKNPNPFLASLQFFGDFFKNFLNWVNTLIRGIKRERVALFLGENKKFQNDFVVNSTNP